MAEQAGCCEGEGRAATVAVLVLSIIVFMANIYAMVAAIDIHAYYWIMTYHFVGTIGVLVATSVFACRCCGEGGFPLRRLGQALAAYVVLCGVVCFVAVLAAKDGAIEDNCAESRECDLSVLFGCPKENQGFYQCVDDPDPVEQVLNDNTCGGKLYAPKWHNWGCDRDDQLGLGGRAAGVDENQVWPQLIGAPKPYGENEDMLPVRQVSAGKHHSVILTESGEVFAMGSNEFGQLGIESPTALPEDAIEGMPIPASVEPFNVWTAPYLNAFTVKDLKVKLERRGESTVGVKAVLVARLLAAQPEHDPVVEVAAGYMHTLARTASGKIYSWGNGEEGRLGLGDEDDRVEPTLAMYVTNA